MIRGTREATRSNDLVELYLPIHTMGASQMAGCPQAFRSVAGGEKAKHLNLHPGPKL
jgi:hypothetical protein